MNQRIIAILVVLFLITFFYRIWDLNKPQFTPDEFGHVGIGIRYWYNILHLDFNPESWKKFSEHPPIGRYIYGLVNGAYLVVKEKELLPKTLSYEEGKGFLLTNKDFTPSRIISIILAALIVVTTLLIGLKFFNFRVAIISSLILSFLPLFVAYTKVATLESPMVFFYTLSVFLFLVALKDSSFKKYLLVAIVVGLAIGTKFNNFTLLVLLPLFFLLYQKTRIKKRKNLIRLITIIILPVVIFYISFPWFWSNPIQNFFLSFQHSSEIASVYKEYFFGSLTQSLPFYYFLIYFFVTTPVILLALFLLSMYKTLKGKNFYEYVLLAWFFIPLIFQSLIPLKAHGIRYILMVLPAFSLLSGIGLTYLLDKFKIKSFGFLIISAIIVTYLLLQNTAVHPYYLDYYNELTGGTENVFNRKLFQVGSWGEGISEAADYLNNNAGQNSSVQFLVGPPTHIIPKMRVDITVISGPEENITYQYDEKTINYTADYIVLNNYFNWYFKDITPNVSSSYKEIYEVKAGGAPITVVYKHK